MLNIVLLCVLLAIYASAWPGMKYGDGIIRESIDLDDSDDSRANKLETITAENSASKYSSFPGYADTHDATTHPSDSVHFFKEDMNLTFDVVSDSMPQGRYKYVHARGTVASVEFKLSTENEYSGLFQGADSCVIRLSLASKPTFTSYVPALALKCLRDGAVQSGNILAIYTFDGQGTNHDFFAHELTNIVPQPKSSMTKYIVDTIFGRASSCPTWLSLKQFAEADQEGNVVEETDVNHPKQIWFVPKLSFKSIGGDWREELGKLAAGTTLYTVEVGESQSTRTSIGEIVLSSEFIASFYGDNYLFFQHDRGEQDSC